MLTYQDIKAAFRMIRQDERVQAHKEPVQLFLPFWCKRCYNEKCTCATHCIDCDELFEDCKCYYYDEWD